MLRFPICRSEWMNIWISNLLSLFCIPHFLLVATAALFVWEAGSSEPWRSDPGFLSAGCAKSSPLFGLGAGASGLCKHWASGLCPRSPQLPRTSGPSSCSAAALSVRPLQASVPLLVSAGARREVPLSHSLPHPQEGDFSMWRGNFLSL